VAAVDGSGECPESKNRTAPPASNAPPAMNPTVEIVPSVWAVEWSDAPCA
jgi:hypothetical protein